MDIDIINIPAESKRNEFSKYLESSFVTELLTGALIKLYKEYPRPQDSMEFIIHQMFPFLPKLEEVKEIKDKIKNLKKEIENFAQEKKLKQEQEQMMKTDSEIESLLEKLFITFDADDTGKSLLKKHLTQELFEDHLDVKTDYEGSLLDNIISGLTHYDSDIGIFASDQTAYKTFEEIFEPILQDLHKTETLVDNGGTKKIISASQDDVNWGDVKIINELDSEGFFIKSVSITVGRALDKIPFAPIIKVNQLNEVKKKAENILMAIDDEELKGKFYELADIEDEQKKKWIDEGILFSEPNDKFLEAAGTYKLWPVGRALFLNDNKNFRVWINEEEHLQITSFEDGGNLREAYQRLVKAMEKFDQLKFSRDERWGFLAHNLKNIGNTMRVSAKVKLPQMLKEKNQANFKTLCDGNQLTFKDLGDGKIELNNSKRMGLTEFETIKAFEKGILEIIIAEKCAYIT